jgi:formate dehydrogenase major subunit
MACQCQSDFGTPASDSGSRVALLIDGRQVSAPAGSSVMRAALEAGIPIPKLCATDQLEAFGSCRLCLVQVEGRRGYPASCTTPVEEGMKVSTQSPHLSRLRRGVMELYISDHPLDCLTCSANGNCELQDMAGVVGLREVRYGLAGDNHFDAAHAAPKDESNPYFSFDPAKCIVCNRCVRACEESAGHVCADDSGRGFASKVTAGAEGKFSGLGMRVLRRLRGSLPDRHADRKIGDRGRPGRGERAHHLRLLRRGLQLSRPRSRAARWCAWSGQIRRRQRRPRLRERPLCLGLRHPPRPHQDADDPRQHRRPLAEVSAGTKRWPTPPASSNASRPATARLAVGGITSITLHQRRNLSGAEAGACRLRQQQRGYLRPGLPLPTGYGLKQTLGESAGTQDFESVLSADVIDGDRRQPHRRPPGVRFAAQAAPARRGALDRHRPARHRSGAHAPCGRRPSPGALARHQRGDDQRAGARHRQRRAGG